MNEKNDFKEVICLHSGKGFIKGRRYAMVETTDPDNPYEVIRGGIDRDELFYALLINRDEVSNDGIELGNENAIMNCDPIFRLTEPGDYDGIEKFEKKAERAEAAIESLRKYREIAETLEKAKRLSEKIKEDLETARFDFSALQ